MSNEQPGYWALLNVVNNQEILTAPHLSDLLKAVELFDSIYPQGVYIQFIHQDEVEFAKKSEEEGDSDDHQT